jgi:hypothetical protein
MARIVPDARLIALLRNPVDRAYSNYQMEVRRGKGARSFEEATQQEMISAEGEGNTVDVPHAYLCKGIELLCKLSESQRFSRSEKPTG